MIPGTTTKLTETAMVAADTIHPKTDIVSLTGTTQINTIRPNFGGGQFSGMLILIPTTGSVILGTTGNILVGITAVINRAVYLTYSKALAKWVINSGV